jgi:soluble lytic murein transglycosylase
MTSPRISAAALATLVALVLAPAASASWRAAVDSLYASAERQFALGNHRSASALYARVAEAVSAHGGAAGDAYLAGLAARAAFLRARSLESLERWDEAAAAYLEALPRLPEVSDAVQFRLGRCYRKSGDLERAVAALREVIGDTDVGGFDLPARESLGDAYREAGDGLSALHWYESMLAVASSDEDVTRARYKIGLARELRGDDDGALASYAAAVNEHPGSPSAGDALKRGRALSRAFTDRYHQGLVAYNRDLLREAAEYFAYYLRSERGEFQAEAAYFLGRCHQRMGSMRSAAGDYERAIELGIGGEYADWAWVRFAYCLRRLGKVDESLAAYDRYAEAHADEPGAAHILWEKARLLEEERRWDEARDAFRELADRHPGSDRAGDALFRAGLCLFKLGQYREAEADFATLYASARGSQAARALYWAGKVRERFGRPQDAAERYREAAAAARESFYGLRSLERLSELGRPSVSALPSEGSRTDVAAWAYDASAHGLPWSGERREFAEWLAGWHESVYVPGVTAAMRGQLSEDRAFVRADLFLGLHMQDAAARELSTLETRFASDPRMLDVLIEYYERRGLHRRAIRFAERVLTVSRAKDVGEAPLYLRKKICPTHWREVVVGECGRRGVDPALFFSLIRQESLFEPGARSGPGARGVTQIMPTTGRWIARQLGERGFDAGDLADPETNIRFGVFYLSVQLKEFGGDVFRSLAAYNAGAGNAERWWGFGGTEDPDVFFEDIGFAETRDYVERVYRYSRLYREIYEAF